ncbi:MAG: hypothetical protein DCF31_12350 [Alphaproteobacteria bacterium]|nr:MAG: hypothetical protein DCF31_12350 [Alphaproteobacteria bacterium]
MTADFITTVADRPAAGALARLLRARQGATGVVFMILTPVLIGAIGFGFDMSRYALARNELQTAADAAALAAAQDVTASPASVAVTYGRLNLPAALSGAITTTDVTVGKYQNVGGFTPLVAPDSNAVKVVLTRSPGRGNKFTSTFGTYFFNTVTATAIAVKPESSNYEPPESTNLDNEAGDYNEIYAYCYNYAGTGAPEARRSQMTLISNNMDNVVSVTSGVISTPPPVTAVWPDCRATGLSISFRLRNIRHAKSMTNLWLNPGTAPFRPEHNYYTDTRITGAVEHFDGLTMASLETVLCNTAAQCDSRLPSFIGRKGRDRTPDRATGACAPGKFMYFGWEDRPPGQSGANGSWTDPAWTDRDYDDIRLLMKCPKGGQLGDAFVRLVK